MLDLRLPRAGSNPVGVPFFSVLLRSYTLLFNCMPLIQFNAYFDQLVYNYVYHINRAYTACITAIDGVACAYLSVLQNFAAGCRRGEIINTMHRKRWQGIYTVSQKQLDHFLFEHNFGKYCPILIILHCCRQKLTMTKCTIKSTAIPQHLLVHYHVKWTRMYWPRWLPWFRN